MIKIIATVGDKDSTYYENKNHNGQEIIITGAFPNPDLKYDQYTVDAVITFASEILKAGYTLTFGSHPTFQVLFMELNKKITADKTKLKMYISKYFENKYQKNRNLFMENADLQECEEVCSDGKKIYIKV